MAKQYYLRVKFEFGEDDGSGHLSPVNVVNWEQAGLSHAQAVALKNEAVLPAMADLQETAAMMDPEASEGPRFPSASRRRKVPTNR